MKKKYKAKSKRSKDIIKSRDKNQRNILDKYPLILFSFKALITAILLVLILISLFRKINPPVTSFMIFKNWEVNNENSSKRKKNYYNWCDFEYISPHMSLAVISSEDQKFAVHRGFDFESIAMAMEYNRTNNRKRGASTLSQQVVKNLFLWPGRSYIRKGFEVVLTALIESLWSKKRILEMYLNIVEFGEGIYGVGAASEQFFKKPPSQLTIQEAALLCAVLPNPILYCVKNPSDAVTKRQKWIVEQYHNLKSDRKIREIVFPKKNDSIIIFL